MFFIETQVSDTGPLGLLFFLNLMIYHKHYIYLIMGVSKAVSNSDFATVCESKTNQF